MIVLLRAALMVSLVFVFAAAFGLVKGQVDWLGRNWSSNEYWTCLVFGVSGLCAVVWVILSFVFLQQKPGDVERESIGEVVKDLSEVEKLDIAKLHLEVNQLRYFELLCCSFAIVLVSAAASAFAKNPSVGVAVVVGVCWLARWHSVIMNVRSRITTYLRVKGWSQWESDYRRFADGDGGGASGSQRIGVGMMFVVLELSPLLVYVSENAPPYLLDGVRPEKWSSWVSFWLLSVFSVLGGAYVLSLVFKKSQWVLDAFVLRWIEKLGAHSGEADSSECGK